MYESRNLLYEIKKKSDLRSSPFYNPVENNDPENQIREELKQLRQTNRMQETELIRLRQEVKQLRNKILFYQQHIIDQQQSDHQDSQALTKQISSIPMVLQSRQLKLQLQHIHEVNLSINGKNRQLQQKNRELESELAKCNRKMKELEILEKVRSENMEREIQSLQPVIVEDLQSNKQYQLFSQSIKKVLEFMRQQTINVSYEIFTLSAKQCENQKKTNSYNVFINYWNELIQQKHLGYMALVQSLKSLQQIQRFIQYDRDEIFDLNTDSKYRDTLNEWVINTLVEIKHTKKNQKLKEQKLFRLLGLYYRSKFPIQGQKYELDDDVKKLFEQTVCQQVFSLVVGIQK